MEKIRPLFIAMTPVRNEAWVLHAKLDIWDNDFIETYNLKDPRNIWIKLLHQYLRKTQKYKSTILVRAIDKVLKIMV